MNSSAYIPRHRALSAGETYDRLVKSSRRSRAGLIERYEQRRVNGAPTSLDERRAQRDRLRPPTRPDAA